VDTLKLEIVTPEAVAYSEDVNMVTLPAIARIMHLFPTTPAQQVLNEGKFGAIDVLGRVNLFQFGAVQRSRVSAQVGSAWTSDLAMRAPDAWTAGRQCLQRHFETVCYSPAVSVQRSR
jgi:hypothetical protein